MRDLRIHAAAAEEAAEAAAWYDAQRPGLGADFARAIDAALDLLEQDVVPLTSLSGVAGARGVRRLVLRRFPYSVVVREFRDAMEQKLHLAHEGLVSALAKWEHVKAEYRAAKRSMDDKRRQLAATLETELIAARARFQQAQTSWSMLIDHAGA